MRMIYVILVAIAIAASTAKASVPVHTHAKAKKHHGSTRNLELWCGNTAGQEKEKFPYLAAIKNYRAKNGGKVQVATVYKKGKVVLRQYVYQSVQPHHLVYESSGDAFSLSLLKSKNMSSYGEFKAVIHDEDGTKLIGNGTLPCYLQGKKS